MSETRTQQVQDLIDSKVKGYWDEDPRYPVEDWQQEIANLDTKQGYWEWVYQNYQDEGEI